MKVCIICEPHYQGDKLFDAYDASRNRDDCLRPWIELRDELVRRGHEVHTNDILAPDHADVRIYNQYPVALPAVRKGSILILLESRIVRPEGWAETEQAPFEHVFGWAPRGTPHYSSLRIPYSFVRPASLPEADRKLLCLISGNKESSAAHELYSARRRLIRWFETHASGEFDLFGFGWESGERIDHGLLRRVLGRLGIERKRPYPSYRGPVLSKLATLAKYKFCIAFENVEGHSGYITEKIFDAMVAGCVPVYRGAPDIAEAVPRDCFIAGSDFSSTGELYSFLKGMSEDCYHTYQDRIAGFLAGPSFLEFSPQVFAKRVADEIIA